VLKGDDGAAVSADLTGRKLEDFLYPNRVKTCVQKHTSEKVAGETQQCRVISTARRRHQE
jgi:hypothetical protein